MPHYGWQNSPQVKFIGGNAMNSPEYPGCPVQCMAITWTQGSATIQQ